MNDMGLLPARRLDQRQTISATPLENQTRTDQSEVAKVRN